MPAAGIAATLPDTIDKVRPSVVGVGVVQKKIRRMESTFSGTGFVVGDGRIVVTNYHVYKGLEKARDQGASLVVFTGRGKAAKARPVRLLRADKAHDLALLQLQGGRLPALRLAGDRLAREGEAVAFTGFPIGMALGLIPATHRGIISAITPIALPASSVKALKAEQIRRIRGGPFLVYQLDGTAYPGNSGSPVYRRDTGEVIGVINSVFIKGGKEAALARPSGISYAIPIKHVRALLGQTH
ncbi:MAG: serine protease [Gammaproteobacteria bacterium]|nr:MAG: serine protease [Gammaproteobacteria bacterium]